MPNPPMSVRITRFLLWCSLVGACLVVGFGILAWIFLPANWGIDSPRPPLIDLVNVVASGAIALSLMGFALRGIHQRKSYGRWLSVVFLVVLILSFFDDFDQSGAVRIVVKAFSQGQLPPIEGRLDETGILAYDNSYPIYKGYADLSYYVLEEVVAILLRVVLPGFLATRLITAQAVKSFFRRE
jgi:hypothetical protein